MIFLLVIGRQQRFTRPYTLFPYTTLFRSVCDLGIVRRAVVGGRSRDRRRDLGLDLGLRDGRKCGQQGRGRQAGGAQKNTHVAPLNLVVSRRLTNPRRRSRKSPFNPQLEHEPSPPREIGRQSSRERGCKNG